MSRRSKYGPKPNAHRCIVMECRYPRESIGNLCASHVKKEGRTGSAFHEGLSHALRHKYRPALRRVLRSLLKQGDFETVQMVNEVRLMLNALPKSLPAIDQAAWHSYDTRAAVIWAQIVRQRFKRIQLGKRVRRTPVTERHLAAYVLTVAMASQLAAEEIAPSLPFYHVVQVAQGINRIAFLRRPLQSKATARRLHGAVWPLCRYWLERHRGEIHAEFKRREMVEECPPNSVSQC
jgi:hypothetical protein